MKLSATKLPGYLMNPLARGCIDHALSPAASDLWSITIKISMILEPKKV